MSVSELLREDLQVMYEDFGEEFEHQSGSKRREFLGIVDLEKDEFEQADSNFFEMKIRVRAKAKEFISGEQVKLMSSGDVFRIHKVEILNREEVELYVG